MDQQENREVWWSRRKKDFILEWFSGEGAGGQHRNRHKNCLRLRDKKTGIVTTGQNHKSQSQNKKEAFKKMVKALTSYYMDLESNGEVRFRAEKGIVRTYNEAENRVVDHLTKEKYSFKNTIGKNNISKIVTDRARFLARKAR